MNILQNNPFSFQDEKGRSLFLPELQCTLFGKTCSVRNYTLIMPDQVHIPFKPSYDHIGGSFWLSSLATCLYICNNKHVFKDKTILELGAGLALPSLYIQRTCLPKYQVASDVILPHELDINTKIIDWFNLSNEDTDTYDVILASDCAYQSTVSYLIQAIKKYSHKDTKIIICNPLRDHVGTLSYSLCEMFEDLKVTYQALQVNQYTIQLLLLTNIGSME